MVLSKPLCQTAVFLFFAAGVFAEDAVKDSSTAQKTEEQVRIEAASTGFAPNNGKDAVIDRLKALFATSNKPIINTKPYVPQEPYMKISTIPASETSAERSIIIYRFRFVSVENVEDVLENLPHAFQLFPNKLNGDNVPLVDVQEAADRNIVMEAAYRSNAEGVRLAIEY